MTAAARISQADMERATKAVKSAGYERRWVDPDGNVFGRAKLLIATREKFNRLSRGYAHPYEVRAALSQEDV